MNSTATPLPTPTPMLLSILKNFSFFKITLDTVQKHQLENILALELEDHKHQEAWWQEPESIVGRVEWVNACLQTWGQYPSHHKQGL